MREVACRVENAPMLAMIGYEIDGDLAYIKAQHTRLFRVTPPDADVEKLNMLIIKNLFNHTLQLCKALYKEEKDLFFQHFPELHPSDYQ